VNIATGGKIAGLSQLVFGLILIVVIIVEPRGLIAMAGNARRTILGGQRP
jgi:ABC-type branched-subunit amino acid transport system permease subunit